MAEVTLDVSQNDVFIDHDHATPLPDDGAGDEVRCILRTPVCDVGGVTVTTRRCAKDRRNLREKRRSTGRVSYSDTATGRLSPVNDEDDYLEVDDETGRNTSYNETPVTSVTSISCCTSGTTSDSTISEYPTSTDGLSDASRGTSSAPEISPSSTASRPANSPIDAAHAVRPTKTGPALPPKPKICSQSAGTGRSPWQPRPPSEKASTTAALDDHTALLARVHELEKVVHEANTENLWLKEMLLMRENRISELETEVEALNKDLDLADEDYEKLEEKNGALVRVVTQLSSR